jgi:phosphonate transport system substrate-binding protein
MQQLVTTANFARLRAAVATGATLAITCCAACTTAAGPAGSAAVEGRSGWPNELRFAMALAPENETEASWLSDPFVVRLQQATGLPIKFFKVTSFSSVVEAMRARRIDGMQVGIFSYLLAEKEAGAEATAVYVTSYSVPAVYDARLRPGYNGIILVKKGKGISSLADLKGRTLVMGDPAGTSDHLVPKTEWIKAGLVPDKDVKTRFAGNHAAAVVALWNDSADAAATADSAMRRIAASGLAEYCGFPDAEFGQAHSPAEIKAVFDACPDGKLVAIHYAPIPGTPFALRVDLPADLKAIIKNSLLETPHDPAFVAAARRWYVDPSVELKLPNLLAYYDSMREMAKLLDLDLTRLK